MSQKIPAVFAEQAELFQLVVENIKEYAVFATDPDGTVVSWNPGVERLLGYTEEQIVGQSIKIIFTDEDRAAGVPEMEMQTARHTGRAEDKRWHQRRDGSRFWANGMVMPLKNDDGSLRGFSKIMRDDTEQKRLNDRQREAAELNRSILESSADCIKVIGLDGDLISMNPPGLCVMEIDDFSQFAGKRWTDFWTEDENRKAMSAVESARAGRIESFQGYAETAKGTRKYWDVIVSPILGADGKPQQILSVSRDISERKATEDGLALLAEISHELLFLQDPREIKRAMSAKIGKHFGVSNCVFAEVDMMANTVLITDAWHVATAAVDLVGRYEIAEFVSDEFRRTLLAGQAVVVSNVETDARTIHNFEKFKQLKIGAFVNTPYIMDGNLKFVLGVYHPEAHGWQTNEIELLNELIARVWTRIERARAEEELRENRAREKFLLALGDALNPLADPEEIQYEAARTLGEYLGANRAGYAEANEDDEKITVTRNYTNGVPSIEGVYRYDDYGRELLREFRVGHAVVRPDIANDPTLTAEEKAAHAALQLGATVNVPLMKDNRLLAVLFAHFTEAHDWTSGELKLIRETAERTWSAVTRVRSEEDLRKSESKYRTLFDSIASGFCIIKMIYDDAGSPIDWRFLEANPAFEKNNSIRDVADKRITELAPNIESKWFEIYGRVARTGEPERFIDVSEALGIWFDVYAFPIGEPEEHKLAVLFNDISAQKNAEAERERLLKIVDAERARLAYIFEQAPAFVIVFRGAEHVYETTNPAYQQLIGHRDVIGKTIREALPDIAEQGYYELLDKVYQTGKVYIGRESVVEFQYFPNGPIEKRIVNFVFQPMIEADNSVSGIFVHGIDITEQVEARKQAENANRLKDEFLATLSHELRTPLSSILGWSKILLSTEVGAEQTRKALETIDRSALAQKQLIEDILDVSRIISGKFRLDIRAVDLAEVIAATVETARPGAEAKNIRLQTLIDPQATNISGDSDRLQQVIWNLLSNALKFTDKDGRVQIRLERVNSHLELTVADTGKGIEPEFLPYVFDRFRQSDGSMTRRQGGLGLGLAIVRQIVELHGGTVAVTSKGAGEGTSFTVSLPLLPVRQEPESETPRVHPAAEIAQQIVKSESKELDGLKILIVDDEADSRTLLTAMIEISGAEVTPADSAAQALEIIDRRAFDVIVSDIGMPEEDGFSLIGKIRKLPEEKCGKTPAVALTAYARAEDRVKALQSGFQIHIAKPVDHAELLAVILSLAGKN